MITEIDHDLIASDSDVASEQYRIWTSEIHTAFAEVAAPIRKLWVLYCESSKPAVFSVAERRDLNWALVRCAPLSEINCYSEPGALPRIAK